MLTTEIDKQPMGSEVVAEPGTTLKMSFWTCLDGLMDRVEVIRDDSLLQTFYGPDNQVSKFSGELEVQTAPEPHAYHVKVFQTDGGWAWSSPIWIVPREDAEQAPAPEAVIRAGDAHVRGETDEQETQRCIRLR
ncbi:MAG: hypothetical protein KAU31_00645 [Spirochaetaceae bacterium]|nr:hypothetical protein [Spirochaetaceae bacterium]